MSAVVFMKLVIRGFLVLLVLLAAACGTSGKRDSAPVRLQVNIAAIPDAIPRVLPRSRYGNPVSYSVFGKSYRVLNSSTGYRKKGIASWYGTKFHGRRTSSGEPYDMYAMTAAHKSLPLPTFVRVTNLKNNKSVVLKVNDRGPFHNDRIIDLSYAAATKLNIIGNGTGLVEVVALAPSKKKNKSVKRKVAKSSVALYVQIGAFSDKSNAQGVKSTLLRSNINNVKISHISSLPQSMFRVRVGPLASVEFADKVLNKLTGLGFDESKIVVE